MAVIDTIRKTGIVGNFVVKFNKRTELFELTLPSSIPIGSIDNKLCYTETFPKIKLNIDIITEQTLSEKQFIKKHIFIDFKTSEGEKAQPSKDGVRYNSDIEQMYQGIGFSICWYVVEEYKVEKPHAFGKIYNLFKITEASRNSKRGSMKEPNILPQIFKENERQLDYSDELYLFLKSLEDRVKTLNSQLKTFFDKDPEKFIENIKSNRKLLS